MIGSSNGAIPGSNEKESSVWTPSPTLSDVEHAWYATRAILLVCRRPRYFYSRTIPSSILHCVISRLTKTLRPCWNRHILLCQLLPPGVEPTSKSLFPNTPLSLPLLLSISLTLLGDSIYITNNCHILPPPSSAALRAQMNVCISNPLFMIVLTERIMLKSTLQTRKNHV